MECSELHSAFKRGAICLLWISTDTLQYDRMNAWRGHLPESEWQRALKYRRERDRISYIASRMILRHSVATLLGIDPVNVSLERDSNGKLQIRNPSVIGPVHVNLSHTDGVCIVALSRMGAIGVDVEPLNRSLPEGFCRFICSEDETREITALPTKARNPALIVLWTLKEALVKASGQGLYAPVETICCNISNGRVPYLRHTGALAGNPGEWSLYNGVLPGGFQWAVAQRAAPAPLQLSRVVAVPHLVD